MMDLNNFSVKVKNLKCFGDSEQGFETIKPMNLIVGRNNSGKSTLLDLIGYIVGGKFDIPQGLWHGGQRPVVIAESPLTEIEIRKVFKEGESGNGIAVDHWVFGRRFIGTRFRWSISAEPNQKYISIGDCLDGRKYMHEVVNATDYLRHLANAKENPLAGRQFRRISAERNIVPEPDSGYNEISSDGRGVTTSIQRFINNAEFSREFVDEKLLEGLNTIFKTDALFTNIFCQRLKENNNWEIYLKEDKKGRIPLSQSGSGLKTVIMVLVYLYLIPAVDKKDLSEFVFGFEELENCLHPALLRRLLSYILQKAKSDGCIFFLTTHSNVEIDLFSKDQNAQILHTTHDGNEAYARTVKTYVENKGILDDLDVRASDLLQSNGIIWVEGPSDRIYLNRWINLWSNSELVEGNHYQCVYYAGKLLFHLSSVEPELVEEGVSILRVNKNAIVLIDSDKKTEQDGLDKTKSRIITEIKKNGGTAWVTRGRTIENYIPVDAIQKWLNKTDVKRVGQYDNFSDYLNAIKEGEEKRYDAHKPLLAEQLTPHMTRENIEHVLDLAEKLDTVCTLIRKWNNL